MSEKGRTWRTRYQPHLIALAVIVWAFVVGMALVRNPSADAARMKLAQMKTDMAGVLAQGGKPLSSEELAKFGRARLSNILSMEGWSSALAGRYERELLARNWTKRPGGVLEYCKGGMSASIKPDAGMYLNQSTAYVSMTYDAETMRLCGG